jgi:hypothetical protein
MTLLHDSKFIFYDKSEAKVWLCLYLGDNGLKAQDPDYDLEADLYDNGVFALYLDGAGTLSFPLVVSDLPIKKYIPHDIFKTDRVQSNISRCIWTTATRIGNSLQLTS